MTKVCDRPLQNSAKLAKPKSSRIGKRAAHEDLGLSPFHLIRMPYRPCRKWMAKNWMGEPLKSTKPKNDQPAAAAAAAVVAAEEAVVDAVVSAVAAAVVVTEAAAAETVGSLD
jgi:hypothetical protein